MSLERVAFVVRSNLPLQAGVRSRQSLVAAARGRIAANALALENAEEFLQWVDAARIAARITALGLAGLRLAAFHFLFTANRLTTRIATALALEDTEESFQRAIAAGIAARIKAFRLTDLDLFATDWLATANTEATKQAGIGWRCADREQQGNHAQHGQHYATIHGRYSF